MSYKREQHVWRVPLGLCGIVNYREGVEPSCTAPVALDWNEFQEEYEELFTWDAGGFSPALCEGDYLDFVILDQAVSGSLYAYEYADKEVFHKILPDLDLANVHYCEYVWYDGGSAPEMW